MMRAIERKPDQTALSGGADFKEPATMRASSFLAGRLRRPSGQPAAITQARAASPTIAPTVQVVQGAPMLRSAPAFGVMRSNPQRPAEPGATAEAEPR